MEVSNLEVNYRFGQLVMGFDLWSDDQVVRDYIYQPARSSPATGQTHEYKALINLWLGAGGGVAEGGGATGKPGGGGMKEKRDWEKETPEKEQYMKI